MKNQILIFLIIFPFTLYSQNNSDYFSDTSYKFQYEYPNMIKLNVGSILFGDVNIQYERFFNRILALEVGGGILLPYYKDYVDAFDGFFSTQNLNGFSYTLLPKVYFNKLDSYKLSSNKKSMYVGIFYRNRIFSTKTETETISSKDIYIGPIYGFQLELYRIEHIYISFNYGFLYYITSKTYKNNPTLNFKENKGMRLLINGMIVYEF